MPESEQPADHATGTRGLSGAGCFWVFLVAAGVLVLGVAMFSVLAGGGRIITSKTMFDRDDWIDADDHWWADPDRIRMCDDLIRQHLQPGARRDEVVATLGDPRATLDVPDGVELWYWLGPHRTDEWWLKAIFSPDGTLVRSWYGSSAPPGYKFP